MPVISVKRSRNLKILPGGSGGVTTQRGGVDDGTMGQKSDWLCDLEQSRGQCCLLGSLRNGVTKVTGSTQLKWNSRPANGWPRTGNCRRSFFTTMYIN